MSKKKLFDDNSDEEVALKTENEYAKKYDAWREKEEIHKLEQKYGPKALDPNASLSSDSEDEDEEPPEVSEEMETQFLKTLALLKTKDPRIYDPNYKFFDENEETAKEKKIPNEDKPKTLTLADSDDDDEDDDDDPNIFTIEKKADIEKEEQDVKNKDDKLKDFLTGKAEHIEDEAERDLEPLKAFWSDPKLNEGEAFLRDYILNKRYLEEGAADEDKLRDDVELEADEALVEEQGKFERAYNFRFEEPDDEYLKRYPRTMNSVRPKDDKRARKRAEIRTRKEGEKKKKMEEIARLKALKLKEVQEKIARIKHVTGNEQLAFRDEDIEGDFDPEEHDRRMKAIFDETYYGEADEQKPVFPELDEELEIENWENFEEDEAKRRDAEDEDAAPHCEDEDFNMDADYDPKKARENLLEELKRNMGKKRRNRKRKTKLGQLLATEKPTFVPDADKTYSEFMEEYYKMDCEDVIGGDLPTRFKYREVVPNDFGLTVEEILLADDKELTQWVPLKKIVKHRPPNVEKSEVNTYKLKAADLALKRKMLPSLFKDLPQEPDLAVPIEEGKKKKRKKKKKDKETSNRSIEETEQITGNGIETILSKNETKTKKKTKRKDVAADDTLVEHKDDEQMELVEEMMSTKLNSSQAVVNGREENAEIIKIDKQEKVDNSEDTVKIGKRKKKHSVSFVVETIGNVEPSQGNNGSTIQSKNTRKRANSECSVNNIENNGLQTIKKGKHEITSSIENEHQPPLSTIKNNDKSHKQNKNFNTKKNNKKGLKRKFKTTHKHKQEADKPTHPFSNLSDERLKAYGLNPKKYKNFLKYKKY